MASLRHWYTGQLVAAQEMRAGDEALESAIRSYTTDLGFVGVYSGFGAVQKAGTPNMSVDVAAGLAYTPDGERVRTATTVNVGLSFDRLGNPTAVTIAGNSKVLAVYAVFDRIPSDPRIDATNNTVYFVQDEGYGFDVVQGAEAVSPSAPAPLTDGVLLALVTITYGQTAVVNANINTTPADWLVKCTGSPFSITTGSIRTALQQIVTRYNNLVTGGADNIAASAITYAGSGPWADSSTIASGTVEGAIDTVVSTLAATTTSNSGARKIGVEQDATSPTTLAASTLQARLVALRDAANLAYGGGPAWANLSSNPAQSVESAIDSIFSGLSSTVNTGTGAGAAKIGIDVLGNFTSSTIRGYFAELVATTTSNDGAKRVGTQSSGNFTGATVRAQLDELTRTSSGDDGAKRVGANVTAGFTAGANTVRAQLDDLQARKADASTLTTVRNAVPVISTGRANLDSPPSTFTSTGTPDGITYHDVLQTVVTFAGCVAGDVIVVDLSALVSCSGSGDLAIGVYNDYGGPNEFLASTSVASYSSATTLRALGAKVAFTLTQAGTARAVALLRFPNGQTMSINHPGNLFAMKIHLGV